jgi:branched-chain amino acid transport system permease protein
MIRVAAGAAVLAVLGLFAPPFWMTLACMAGIGALVALGLVLLTGYAGMTSFGQASFLGFGAYTTALLTTQLGWSPWLALPLSLLVAGIAALLIGAVTLRLSGHYLALASIAWSVSLFFVAGNLDLLHRNDGIQGIPPLTVAGWRLTDSGPFFPVVALALVLALWAVRNLLDSRPGRAIRALRGGADAASSCGVSIWAARLLVFVCAGVLAGLAGFLYAHLQRSVNPTPFGLVAGIEYLLMTVLGGIGHPGGAVLGAVLVTLANDRLQDWLPLLLGQGGSTETIVFGALMVLVLQFAPDGVWPFLWREKPHAKPVPDAPPLPRRPHPVPGTLLLEARDLARRFGGLAAVDGLDLHLHAGEILALIGPNGAGKSTSFNLLSGVLPPSAGSVAWLGKPRRLTPQRAARLGLARSFQHVRLLPDMSVRENVALGAHLRGHAGPLAALLRLDRADEGRLLVEAQRALVRVGLAELADRPAGSLALGQQRIVEVARALCADPLALLLDEPAAGLRHQEKQALAELLRGLRAEGMGLLLVEHDMEFVMNLADRVVVMEFGRMLSQGSADDVRRDPAVIEAYLGAA